MHPFIHHMQRSIMKTTTASPPTALPTTGFIRQAQLLRYVPVSPATLWRWVKSGRFATPLKLSGRITAWRCEDVRHWIEAQSQETKPTGSKGAANA